MNVLLRPLHADYYRSTQSSISSRLMIGNSTAKHSIY